MNTPTEQVNLVLYGLGTTRTQRNGTPSLKRLEPRNLLHEGSAPLQLKIGPSLSLRDTSLYLARPLFLCPPLSPLVCPVPVVDFRLEGGILEKGLPVLGGGILPLYELLTTNFPSTCLIYCREGAQELPRYKSYFLLSRYPTSADKRTILDALNIPEYFKDKPHIFKIP